MRGSEAGSLSIRWGLRVHSYEDEHTSANAIVGIDVGNGELLPKEPLFVTVFGENP